MEVLPVILLPLLICSLLTLFSSLLTRPRRSGIPLPPSPWRLPLIGNFHQLSQVPHQALHSLAQKYGPLILLHFGSKPFILVSSGELARQVTKTHDLNFLDLPQTKASQLLFADRDNLLFSPHGHFWRCARKICVNELLSARRVHSFHHIRDEEVAKLVAQIRSSSLTRSPINLGDLFLALGTYITSRAVLGQRCKGDADDDADNDIGELSKQASELLSAFSFGEFIPALSWLDNVTGFTRRGTKISKAIHAFFDRVIDEHEAGPDHGSGSDPGSNHRQDFVDILLELRRRDDTGLDLTRENIRSILVDIFVGGTDTTAVTMEWAMAELMKNPRAMKRVQEEIRSVVGEKSKIHESDIHQMTT